MTVFDVIRYPVSLPPTREELEALPKIIYWDWIRNHTQDWHQLDDTACSPWNVAIWMAYYHRDSHEHQREEIQADVHRLRQLIAEYEPV
jgi:hypothetical protein